MRRETDARTSRPNETTEVHTRILRCMLAADDCAAYWQHVDPQSPLTGRAQIAFEQRWFGLKSEARVRTIMTDMIERFDAYPEALALFQELRRIPTGLRTLICHIHTQLADPVYRAFSGDFLPARREEGRKTVDRAAVTQWVEQSHPGRWSAVTCVKFASNLLATAHDVGLVTSRRDPRGLPHPIAPEVIVGYLLYLLRGIDIEGSLTENPYLRSLGLTTQSLGRLSSRIPGVRIDELAGVAEVTFELPTLKAFGLRYLVEAS